MRDEPEILDIKDLPSNARTKDKAAETKQKLDKVVSGNVRQQKKGIWRKFTSSFVEENSSSVGEYVLYDVLIPAFKSMILDMINGAGEMWLHGSRSGKRTFREGGRSYPITNYQKISYRGGGDPRERDRQSPRELSRAARATHDFDEVVFDTRGDAERVLSELVDLVDSEYRQATVADFLDACGLEHSYTDNKYGWTDLHEAYVSRVRGGFVISLPRTKQLD